MSLQVFIKREGEKISLIVDGINAQFKRIPGGRDRTRLTGPLYVGGVPPSMTVKKNPQTTNYKPLVSRMAGQQLH